MLLSVYFFCLYLFDLFIYLFYVSLRYIHSFPTRRSSDLARHVERLSLDVDGSHVDPALHAQERGRRRGGHAVLPGSGLRDQPGLAQPLRAQRLAEGVVDLRSDEHTSEFLSRGHLGCRLLLDNNK